MSRRAWRQLSFREGGREAHLEAGLLQIGRLAVLGAVRRQGEGGKAGRKGGEKKSNKAKAISAKLLE